MIGQRNGGIETRDMKTYRITFWLATAILTFSLAAGFLDTAYWMVPFGLFPILILLFIFRQRSFFWIGTLFLSMSILFAVIGIIAQVPLMPMIIAASSALASWDLYLFRPEIHHIVPEKSKPTLIRDHLSSLGLVICSGFLLAVIGSCFKFELPFGLTVLLVLLMMILLMGSMKYLNGRNQ